MGRNRPTTAELIEAVTEFLATEVDPEVTAPDVKFRLRVARNVLDIVARECRTGLEHDRREEIALQELLGQEFLGKKTSDLSHLNEALCERLRRGDFDNRLEEALPVLTDITMDKLSIDNPRFSTFKDLKQQ